MPYTLLEIADVIGAELHGDKDCIISGIATLHNAGQGDLSFLANRRYLKFLNSTGASAVIVSPDDMSICRVNALVTKDPYSAYAKAARYLYPQEQITAAVHTSAVIDKQAVISPTAHIGANTFIAAGVNIADRVYVGPGCVIESEASIGIDTRLVANITVCKGVSIGMRSIIHPGVVLGADGFGIANDNGKWLKVPQLGSVRIGNDVELGANTTIDRGALEDTIIEDGVKIDNQVQIGHNTRIGEHTAIAGCCAIAGSVSIGKRCMIGGLTAIAGHIEIADDVIITGMSGVSNSIKKDGTYSSGLGVTENKLWRKNMARFKQLDELARKIIRLEKKLDKE
jgi:UDP-3-O-[3-hydroxymyristoyl] glucosamine N-acyltransferase